jgi:hypothetical protein
MLALCFGKSTGGDAGKHGLGTRIIAVPDQPVGAGQQVVLLERCAGLFGGLQVKCRGALEVTRCLPCVRLRLETLVRGGRHYGHAGAAATDQRQAGYGKEDQDGGQTGWVHCGRLLGAGSKIRIAADSTEKPP